MFLIYSLLIPFIRHFTFPFPIYFSLLLRFNYSTCFILIPTDRRNLQTFCCSLCPWTFLWSYLCFCIGLKSWRIRQKRTLLRFCFELHIVGRLFMLFKSSNLKILVFWIIWRAIWPLHNIFWEIFHMISSFFKCKALDFPSIFCRYGIRGFLPCIQINFEIFTHLTKITKCTERSLIPYHWSLILQSRWLFESMCLGLIVIRFLFTLMYISHV